MKDQIGKVVKHRRLTGLTSESGIYSGGNKKPVRKRRGGPHWAFISGQWQCIGGYGAGSHSREVNTCHLLLYEEEEELTSHPSI